MAHMCRNGVHVDALSGKVNLKVRDPFDEIKVVVKRGEVDWVHIVPSPVWVSHQTVFTKIVKLCRVAHRRNILWSVENPESSRLWTCNEVSQLWDIGNVLLVVKSGVQVVTNVQWWNPDMNVQQVVDTFKVRLNQKCPDYKEADWTITGDRVTGKGVQDSFRVVREDENEKAIGGLRNAARAVDRVPGWKVVGNKISKIIEELVEKNQQTLEIVLSRLGDKSNSAAVPEALCVEMRSKLVSIFQMNESALHPGPGGLFPGLVQALTEAAQVQTFTSTIGCAVRSSWASQCPSRQGEFSLLSLRRALAKSVTGYGI